jgi:diguanylate cyclase (GGDEF)-like protein/PAS domain S-box-containing protein
MIILCVGLAASLALGLTAINYAKASAGLQDVAESAMASDAQVAVSTIDSWNAARLKDLRIVAALPATRHALAIGTGADFQSDVRAVQDILDQMAAANPDVDSIGLLGPDGVFVISSSPLDVGSSVAQRDYFHAAMNGQTFISGVSISTITNRPAIFHSVPVADEDGTVVGVLRSRATLDAVQRTVQAAQGRAGAGSTGLLLDENGLVIDTTDHPGWLLRPVLPLQPDVAAALAQDKRWGNNPAPNALDQSDLLSVVAIASPTVLNWHLNGVPLHAVAVPLEKTHWTYISALPLTSFQEAAQDLLRTGLLALVLGLACASVLAVLIARPLTRTVRVVTAAAHGLARGDLNQVVDMHSGDEIGNMAAAFREMVAYHQRMAAIADAIAAGDLNVEVEPQSDRDRLGVALHRMIGNLRHLVARLEERGARLHLALEAAHMATWDWDLENDRLMWTGRTERLFGVPADAFAGTSSALLELVHPEDRSVLRAAMRAAATGGGEHENEFRIIWPDGATHWIVARSRVDRSLDSGSAHATGVYLDITARKVAELELASLAFTDVLTGLPNRAAFIDEVECSLDRADADGHALGVLFVDLDNFKVINDTLGHTEGDHLLRAVATRLRACLPAGMMAARIGGDEFTVLIDEPDAAAIAPGLAANLAERLRAPISLGERNVFVSASVGLALSAPGQDDPQALLRRADLALYRAKAEGKARAAAFDPSLERTARARLDLETDLRQALDRCELRVFYQPMVSLADAQTLELEALVRWEHPSRGLILPSEFIGVAEETGLIVPIGRWVVETACRDASWLQAELGRTIGVSVNLSSRQFQYPELVSDVADALQRAHLDSASLCLELTESIAMRDAESAIGTLRALKELGVRLAIDDFGTGYSSLAYLKRFPIDRLKIDRSFVDGLGHDPQDEAIVASILAVAGGLGLEVVGEGIETATQRVRLAELGCPLGQGYFFARPQPLQSLAHWLAAREQEQCFDSAA